MVRLPSSCAPGVNCQAVLPCIASAQKPRCELMLRSAHELMQEVRKLTKDGKLPSQTK